MKILATTLGETAGDFLSMTLNLGYYVGFGITFAALLVILFFQIATRRFYSPLFWLAIVATTTAGTEISDMMDRSFGLGYMSGSIVLTLGLLASLGVWYFRDAKLDVVHVSRRDTETLFWVAVLFSNSLGTAFGDFLTDNMELSYVAGAIVTAAIIGIVVALHYLTKISDVLLFWVAFIFTRPFGATFGDFLTKPIEKGGLNLPRGDASLVTLGLLIVVLLLSMRMTRARTRVAQPA
ncbi:hypothetical protein B5K03_33705 [Rhizobium phaseoli]|nr:hypothetical protein B5K03_33705 [Rhizobium phaseoli]